MSGRITDGIDGHAALTPDCPACGGTGLVCEEHPERRWDDGDGGCSCGAPGMPCEVLPPKRRHQAVLDCWWACEWPERPNDEDAIFDDECAACCLAFEAAARLLKPDQVLQWRPTRSAEPVPMLVVEARARNWPKVPDHRVRA